MFLAFIVFHNSVVFIYEYHQFTRTNIINCIVDVGNMKIRYSVKVKKLVFIPLRYDKLLHNSYWKFRFSKIVLFECYKF